MYLNEENISFLRSYVGIQLDAIKSHRHISGSEAHVVQAVLDGIEQYPQPAAGPSEAIIAYNDKISFVISVTTDANAHNTVTAVNPA